MKSMCVCNSAYKGRKALTTNFRKLRKVFGLAIAAIGLSASIASAADPVTVTVANPSFETGSGIAPPVLNELTPTNWAELTDWTFQEPDRGRVAMAGQFGNPATGSSYYLRYSWNNAGVEQNLNTTVSAGSTLSVTCDLGKDNAFGSGDVTGYAYFKVGTTYYYMPYNLSSLTKGTWQSFTFTTAPITAGGALSVGFRVAYGSANNQYCCLDNVSDVTVTPPDVDPNMPTSTSATLAALENTATPLAASDFGYADPNSSPLANVQITSLPALGSLKLIGTAVTLNQIVTVADINSGNLTYLSPLGGYGTAYTTIGIKVQNSVTPTGLWSLPATMTVNVTHVNHAPTSTGGSVTMRVNTTNTFATTDFQFSDVDAGNTLGAIKVVTSLPTHGTLKLGGTPVALNDVIPVASIGTLTYTPTVSYTGPDSFNFQVSDGTAFSADATLAISVTTDILVQNGSFETHGALGHATYWWSLGSPWVGGISPQGYEVLQVNQFNTFTAAADGIYAVNLESWLVSVTQNLGTTVNEGDTLSMTFSGGKNKAGQGGKFTASFVVGTTEYTSSDFDTNLQANDTWQSYTFTKKIANTGNLSIKFGYVSGNRPWLDKVSNVSVIPAPPKGTVIILW